MSQYTPPPSPEMVFSPGEGVPWTIQAMDGNIARLLIERGIWIPHLYDVKDAEGNLIYQNAEGRFPSDYGKIIIPLNWKDDSGATPNLIEMNSALRGELALAFWQDVFTIPERLKTRKDKSLIYDSYGKPQVRWAANDLWNDHYASNAARRDGIRAILYNLQWLYLPQMITYITERGETRYLADHGQRKWGLSFVFDFYKAFPGLCYNFFEKFQQKVGESSERWDWMGCQKEGNTRYRQLTLLDAEEEKVEAPAATAPAVQGFVAPPPATDEFATVNEEDWILDLS